MMLALLVVSLIIVAAVAMKLLSARQTAISAGAGALALAGSAMAEVPAAVTTSFTEMASDFADIFAAGFTVLAAVVLAMLSWRYFKKLGSKV